MIEQDPFMFMNAGDNSHSGDFGMRASERHLPVHEKKKKKSKIRSRHSGHGSNPALAALPDSEYETVRRFPKLAEDSLSFEERRSLTQKNPTSSIGSIPFGSRSVSSVRSSNSLMSELTKSPFERGMDNFEGPLSSIRRSMLEKKRNARVLPSLKRRASVIVPCKIIDALESAKHKVRQAAKNYDRYRDGKALTDCFADYQLNAIEFRTALRRSLTVDLTPEESEKLLVDSDLDGNGTLDGAEFLMMFFKLAHEEKSKVAHKIQARKAKFEEDEKEKKEQERKFQLVSDSDCFDTNFSDQDKNTALRRLANHARTFDVLSEDGRRTSANFSCVLRPAALKEQLLKSFGMKVNKKELGAIISVFDNDGDGEVSGAEFMTTFGKLGMIARMKERKKVQEAVERRRERGLLQPLTHQQLGR
jgi:Ca2+-binding EF-hand superfamily protein